MTGSNSLSGAAKAITNTSFNITLLYSWVSWLPATKLDSFQPHLGNFKWTVFNVKTVSQTAHGTVWWWQGLLQMNFIPCPAPWVRAQTACVCFPNADARRCLPALAQLFDFGKPPKSWVERHLSYLHAFHNKYGSYEAINWWTTKDHDALFVR